MSVRLMFITLSDVRWQNENMQRNSPLAELGAGKPPLDQSRENEREDKPVMCNDNGIFQSVKHTFVIFFYGAYILLI